MDVDVLIVWWFDGLVAWGILVRMLIKHRVVNLHRLLPYICPRLIYPDACRIRSLRLMVNLYRSIRFDRSMQSISINGRVFLREGFIRSMNVFRRSSSLLTGRWMNFGSVALFLIGEWIVGWMKVDLVWVKVKLSIEDRNLAFMILVND